jgi:hypothetical protein
LAPPLVGIIYNIIVQQRRLVDNLENGGDLNMLRTDFPTAKTAQKD